MNDDGPFRIDLGQPSILEFRGPDAVRFLNGQVTQDVRRVVGAHTLLPSCVTDAKGRLQFRVFITEADNGALWILSPAGTAGDLEARLTRYLIADDVETADLSGLHTLVHLTAPPTNDPPPGVVVRQSARYARPGADWLIPAGAELPGEFPELSGERLEAFRIAARVPAWGAELGEGMLPPEAGLDETDISYGKGCYIGQEVISRIKSAGKVNRRLTAFFLDADTTAAAGDAVLGPDDTEAGVLTSVSPLPHDGRRPALGYLKRGRDEGPLRVRDATGGLRPIHRA
jgi:folate-binding protein YgfZ